MTATTTSGAAGRRRLQPQASTAVVAHDLGAPDEACITPSGPFTFRYLPVDVASVRSLTRGGPWGAVQ